MNANYEVSAWGTTVMGNIYCSTKQFYAKNEAKAIKIAKRFARRKERWIGWRHPNFSMYEDRSYPNSIGVEWSLKKTKQ